uniref:Cytochrome c oxidase subunit 3 n=1 Tax=Zele chlorophthalmus TaxID=1080924 RepID=A0A345X0Q3_ZELCH|nr:cytochrome c oxidase subunit III [Zele chlorophthalmus]AXK15295.1 cytochrome c oxidase subunit 3 [Zele chlorophthalmus]
MNFFSPFHYVTISPWPLMMALSLSILMLNSLMFINEMNFMPMMLSMILILLIMYQWWRDVIRESTYQGMHTITVVTGLKFGMLMFITSELMFFLSFFWTFFHLMLSPSIEVGSLCPPFMILTFNPFNIPLLNTLILLSSGVTITLCHHLILQNKLKSSLLMIKLTLLLGMVFSMLQLLEYKDSFFTINDSMYGSIFFITTGFHGLHVLIGSTFILVTMIRLKTPHFTSFHHFGFEGCSWYWHFVDVIWLFLYIFMYWMIY